MLGPLAARHTNRPLTSDARKATTPLLGGVSVTAAVVPAEREEPRTTRPRLTTRGLRPSTPIPSRSHKENRLSAGDGGGWTLFPTANTNGGVQKIRTATRPNPHSARRMSGSTAATTAEKRRAHSSKSKKKAVDSETGSDGAYEESRMCSRESALIAGTPTSRRKKKSAAIRPSVGTPTQLDSVTEVRGCVWPPSALSSSAFQQTASVPTSVSPNLNVRPFFVESTKNTVLAEVKATLCRDVESLLQFKAQLEVAITGLVEQFQLIAADVAAAEMAMQLETERSEQLLQFVGSEWALRRSAMVNRVAQLEENIEKLQ